MKKNPYILFSILLLPFMVFTYSGLKIHYHFCGKTGETFAFFEVNGKNDLMRIPCQCSHEESACCSEQRGQADRSFQLTDEANCCSDYITEIRTDEHFPADKQELKLKILVLRVTPLAIQAEEKAYNTLITQAFYPSPPEQEYLSVFRL